MKTQHINFDLPEETKNYHLVLRNAIITLVKDCQQKLGRDSLQVLDVGCGRGELLADLVELGVSAYGVDMEEKCVLLSQQFAPVSRGNIYKLDDIYPQKTFDIVIASHILEHLENPKQGVEMLKRISSQFLILAVPNLGEWRTLRARFTSLGFVNRGHQVGWDPAHFNTFLTFACNVKIEKWQPDRVYVPRFLRFVLRHINLLDLVQDQWLPQQFPLQSHSLIVLCSNKS